MFLGLHPVKSIIFLKSKSFGIHCSPGLLLVLPSTFSSVPVIGFQAREWEWICRDRTFVIFLLILETSLLLSLKCAVGLATLKSIAQDSLIGKP